MSVSIHELWTTVLVAFHPGFQIKVPQYTVTHYIMITAEITEQHRNFIYYTFNAIKSDQSNMTSKTKAGQVNSPISPDIVRWRAITSSPAWYLLKQVRKVIMLSLICLIIKTIIHNTHIIPQIFLNKLIIIIIYSGTYIVWLAVDQRGFQLLYPQTDYLLYLLLYYFQTSQWYLNSEVDRQMYCQNLLVYFQTSLCSDLEKLHHNLIKLYFTSQFSCTEQRE